MWAISVKYLNLQNATTAFDVFQPRMPQLFRNEQLVYENSNARVHYRGYAIRNHCNKWTVEVRIGRKLFTNRIIR